MATSALAEESYKIADSVVKQIEVLESKPEFGFVKLKYKVNLCLSDSSGKYFKGRGTYHLVRLEGPSDRTAQNAIADEDGCFFWEGTGVGFTRKDGSIIGPIVSYAKLDSIKDVSPVKSISKVLKIELNPGEPGTITEVNQIKGAGGQAPAASR